jgi:hypothetical protein
MKQSRASARSAAGAVTTAYKAPAGALTLAVVGLTIGYVSIQSGILASDPDTVVGWSVSLPLLALFASLLCWLFRRATLVSGDAIGVRGLTGTRRIPWADIQIIAIERNASAWMASRAPSLQLVIYDWLGQRRRLPNLDDMNLRHRILSDVAREIVARWQQGRGPEWAPDPEVSRLAALGQRRRAATSHAVALMVVAISAAAVILLVLLILA